MFLFVLQSCGDLSSPTRNWTCTPCIGRRSLNHWTAREVSYFELIFVSGVRQGSSFILLHRNIQFSQNFKGFDPFSSSLQWYGLVWWHSVTILYDLSSPSFFSFWCIYVLRYHRFSLCGTLAFSPDVLQIFCPLLHWHQAFQSGNSGPTVLGSHMLVFDNLPSYPQFFLQLLFIRN